jgi:hypothetical protein
LDVRGLPVCGGVGIQFSQAVGPEGPLPERCEPALVGKGRITLSIAVPEEQEQRPKSELWIFNGGARTGVTNLYAYAQIATPAPAGILVKIKLKAIDERRFGSEAVVSIPKIAGGSGSIVSFDATIGRRFTYEGRQRSLLSLRCPAGAIFTSATAFFDDGTAAGSDEARACAERPRQRRSVR